jgi:maltose alpha-D-glucosyltransferase / alpha-amylase
MKRLIQVGRQHRAFGRGSIEFLAPENPHVLAYLREHDDDAILVVNNLSGARNRCGSISSGSHFAGSAPARGAAGVQTDFLPIDESPYALTLSPYGFFWFALRAIVRVRYQEGKPEQYLLPLTLRPPLTATEEVAPILSLATASRDVTLFEALSDPSAPLALLGLIGDEAELASNFGRFRGRLTSEWKRLSPDSEPVRRLTGEQSNTSIVLGESAVLKVFRKLEEGFNPDLEISRFLVEHTQFRSSPALAGWVEYVAEEGGESSVAALYEYIANRGDAWSYTVRMLERFFNAASRSAADPDSASGGAAMRRMAGEYLQSARGLGAVTGELHLALASADRSQVDFAPARISSEDVQRWIEANQREGAAILADLGRRLDAIPGAFPSGLQSDLATVVRHAPDLRQRMEDLKLLSAGGVLKCRIHGDYHLGQILRAEDPASAGGEWFILDFEGEPARPLEERRRKHSPLRDVAGMLRSFDYAVQKALREVPTDDLRAQNMIRAWAAKWEESVRMEFLRGYRETVGNAPFVPADEDAFHRTLLVFELEKALYELGYEINNRPDWISVPLRGIVAIASRTS